MNSYIFYIERTEGPHKGTWVYDMLATDTFAKAYAVVFKRHANNVNSYAIRAAEVYHRQVVGNFVGSDFAKRASYLIKEGIQFPEGFRLEEDTCKQNVAGYTKTGQKIEILPECHNQTKPDPDLCMAAVRSVTKAYLGAKI